MVVCTAPECQTTVGCQCRRSLQPPAWDHFLMRGSVFAVQASGKTPEQIKEMFARAILHGFYIGNGTVKVTDDVPWHGSK